MSWFECFQWGLVIGGGTIWTGFMVYMINAHWSFYKWLVGFGIIVLLLTVIIKGIMG